MKKKVILVIVLFFLTFTVLDVNAEAHCNYYAETVREKGMKSFLDNNIGQLLLGYNQSTDLKDIRYTELIIVNNSEFDSEGISVVYLDNKPYGTVFAYKKGNEYQTSFSEEYASEIDHLLSLTTEHKPLSIKKDNYILMGYVDNVQYDFKLKESKYFNVKEDESKSLKKQSLVLYKVDNDINSTRSIISYCSWETYYNNSSAISSCVAMTMYNIHRNMGYSGYYSYENYKENLKYILNPNNPNSYTGHLGYDGIETFLDGFVYQYSYSHSGSMSQSAVLTTIMYNHRYIMMINSVSGEVFQHATALIGVSIDNANVYYTIFNPFGTGNGRVITTYANTITFSSNGKTYTWNLGYYNDIRI